MNHAVVADERAAPETTRNSMRKVVAAASLGTVFEWYDFYLYGSLAAVIAKKFFSGADPSAGFLFALLAFAAGFMVRPFGALVFGRLGDLVGRKYTFLVTIIIMGGSTLGVGLLPSYATIGITAPIILVILRMLQGLALGGEYGGAATYIAEHSPRERRGRNTSWLQSTGSLGLLLSLVVILVVRMITGDKFDDWGWRVPFLLSLVLLAISTYIRMSMKESPAFANLKREGKLSKAPVKEAFGKWENLRIVLVALFAICVGTPVVVYTAIFYPLFFLTETLKVDPQTTTSVMLAALVVSPLFFWTFGTLSDYVGRKPVILCGYILAAATFFPIFKGITHYANPALAEAQRTSPIVVHTDTTTCSFQFNPTGTRTFKTPCDIARRTLATNSATYATEALPAGSPTWISVGNVRLDVYETAGVTAAGVKNLDTKFKGVLRKALDTAGYPRVADPKDFNWLAVFGLLLLLMVYQGMVYGPGAATLVEMFPTRIRYTALSVPYHIANGWIGGLLPTFAFALVAQTGNIYFGLWYPVIWIVIAAVSLIVFYRESRHNDINL